MNSNNTVISSQLNEQMNTAIPNEAHTVINADLGRQVAGVPYAIHGTRIFLDDSISTTLLLMPGTFGFDGYQYLQRKSRLLDLPLFPVDL